MNNGNGAVAVWEGMPVAKSLEEFAAGVRRICNFKREFEFRLGQWLVENRKTHGDLIWQWADELPYTHSQLSNFMWVAQSIGEQYTPEIPWTWWQSMAAIPAFEREGIISRALAKTINRDGIRALVSTDTANGSAMAVDGVSVAGTGVPSELDNLESDLARAYVTVGKLIQRRERGPLTRDALDSLVDAAMKLREKL